MKITFANDLGNGSMKGCIDGKFIHIPSIINQDNNDIPDPLRLKGGQLNNYVSNYFDHMDMSIQSSSLHANGRYFVGNNANRLPITPQGFNISSYTGKSKTDLSLQLTLSVIAGEALKRYVAKNGKLPSRELTANVDMVTSLPIMEGSHNHARQKYSHRYTQCDHTVAIRNFENPLNVKIHFNTVLVMLEGQSAQYVIKHATGDLLDSISDDIKKNYSGIAKYIKNPKEITSLPYILGIDIGEGTTDFAFFDNGKLNEQGSSSINMGYGNVLKRAVKQLQQLGMSVNSREQLKQQLSAPTNFINRQIKPKLNKVVTKNLDPLKRAIANEMSDDLQPIGEKIDIVFVYGGGAAPMETYLRESLENDIKSIRSGVTVPIVFIDKKFAQNLNVLGLNMVLKYFERSN